MIHEDGIEVYLKPHGPENEDVKFAEFALRDFETYKGDGEERNKRCLVLAREGNFDIVVRCHPSFRMYSASAIRIVARDGRARPGTLNGITVQRSRIFEQHLKADNIFLERTGPVLSATKLILAEATAKLTEEKLIMADAVAGMRGTFDGDKCTQIDPNRNTKGSVTVLVQRTNPKWVDASAGQRGVNRFYGSGDPTALRRFQYGKTKLLKGKNGDPYIFEFRYRSEDCIRSAHKTLSGALHETTMGSVDSIESIGLVNDADFRRIRDLDHEERRKTSEAWKRRQAAFNKDGSSSPETTSRFDATAEHTGKPKVKKSKPEPEFCDCPDPSHNQPKPKATSANTNKPRSSPSESPKRQNSHKKEPNELSEEPKPRVCSRCKKFKVANSKRPAFLRKWYADEEEDQDNDEVDQEPKPEVGQDQAHDNDIDAARQATASTTSFPAEPPQDQSAAEGNEITQTPPDNPVEDAVASTSTESQCQVQDGESVFSIEEHSSTATQAPEANQATPSVVEEGTAVADSDTGEAQPLQPNQNVDNGTVTQQRSEKRATSIPVEEPPPKKARVDIDLTIDDDDDIIIIKEEPGTQTDVKQPAESKSTEDELDLQEELDDLMLQEQELQVKRKKMEVQRKLREFQKKKPADRFIKSEGVIKIED
ncbi:hypothetical protein PRZ48_002713 [Zasmidium cellare]|uniref:Uncharacterized protein n=1 Tax=Zasmidium cellare TaxID=395010 RepID=A0ABR0ET01_ZASCE|nr:hypothetical protein PRZ48_002713 [Zasmidium cellare]